MRETPAKYHTAIAKAQTGLSFTQPAVIVGASAGGTSDTEWFVGDEVYLLEKAGCRSAYTGPEACLWSGLPPARS